jgi:hypothetical protein
LAAYRIKAPFVEDARRRDVPAMSMANRHLIQICSSGHPYGIAWIISRQRLSIQTASSSTPYRLGTARVALAFQEMRRNNKVELHGVESLNSRVPSIVEQAMPGPPNKQAILFSYTECACMCEANIVPRDEPPNGSMPSNVAAVRTTETHCWDLSCCVVVSRRS